MTTVEVVMLILIFVLQLAASITLRSHGRLCCHLKSCFDLQTSTGTTKPLN